MKFTFIEEQLQLASNFANIFTSDNHSKLLETKKVQNSLQVLRSNDETADFTNKDFLLESLGRKYKCCIYRLLPIAYKLYTQYTKYIPIQISTTSSNLLDIYINKSNLSYNNNNNNLFIYDLSLVDTFEETDEYLHFKYNHRDISRIFADLQDLGIMICVDDFYTYNHNQDVSKTYILSAKLLKSILSLSNININKISHITYNNNNNNSFIYDLSLVDTFDSWSKKDIEVYNKCKSIIEKCLMKQDMLPVDCKYYLSREDTLRPYAKFCSQWKSLEKYCIKNNVTETEARNNKENIGIEWREDYLDKYFGKGNWIEFDRNASIYNVTLLYNKGIYRPNNSGDMYAEFNGEAFLSKSERQDFKLCNMSFYFGDVRKLKSFYEKMSRTANLWLDYENGKRLSVKDQKIICHFLNEKERFASMLKFSGCYKNARTWEEGWQMVKDWYIKTRNNMVSIIGKPYKKTIFMMEAAINLNVAERIREYNYKVLEVYDGFYTDCKDTELLENIYKNTSLEVIDNIKRSK